VLDKGSEAFYNYKNINASKAAIGFIMYTIDNNVVWRSVGDTVFVYSQDGSQIHKFNDVGQFIWLTIAECENKQIDIETLTAAVEHTYEVSPQQARQDVSGFVDELVGKGLIKQT